MYYRFISYIYIFIFMVSFILMCCIKNCCFCLDSLPYLRFYIIFGKFKDFFTEFYKKNVSAWKMNIFFMICFIAITVSVR